MSDTFAVRYIRPIVLGLLLTACFDVKQVDVMDDRAPAHALVIDDFEDGDWLPLSPLFVHWFCQGEAQCGVFSPGASGLYGYSMTFGLWDPPDGKPNFGNAQIRTWRSSGTGLDFTHYEELVFSAKLVPDERGLPDSFVNVLLSCAGGGPAADVICTIDSRVPAGTGWQTYKLRLEGFGQPIYLGNPGKPLGGLAASCETEPKIDKDACLTQIDGVSFQILPS